MIDWICICPADPAAEALCTAALVPTLVAGCPLTRPVAEEAVMFLAVRLLIPRLFKSWLAKAESKIPTVDMAIPVNTPLIA